MAMARIRCDMSRNYFISPVVMHGWLLGVAFCPSVQVTSKKNLTRNKVAGPIIDVDDPEAQVDFEGQIHRSRSPGKKTTLFHVSFDHITGNLYGRGSHGWVHVNVKLLYFVI